MVDFDVYFLNISVSMFSMSSAAATAEYEEVSSRSVLAVCTWCSKACCYAGILSAHGAVEHSELQ